MEIKEHYNIGIFGTGYVGLVTGACLASLGHKVICCDIDQQKIAMLMIGQVPIFEKGLEEILKNAVIAGNLKFTTNAKYTVINSDINFICVGTPEGNDGHADLRFVYQVAETIGKYMQHETIIVDKSTVPVGTGDKVNDIIAQQLAIKNQNIQYAVVSNPEFLREGVAVQDFLKPDRVVIGADVQWAIPHMESVYKPMKIGGATIFTTNLKTAELIKYASNAMLAVRISFANEISRLCEAVGADIELVTRGVGLDKRIGSSFLKAGAGYGGSCFPKDTKALIKTAKDNGIDLKVVAAAEEANADQKMHCAEKVEQYFKNNLAGKKFAVWGLAFKADTDDMREAPAITIINYLTSKGAEIIAIDPEAIANARKIFEGNHDVAFSTEQHKMLEEADGLIILTEWKVFKEADFAAMREYAKRAIPVFDFRNLFYDRREQLRRMGFEWIGVGVK